MTKTVEHVRSMTDKTGNNNPELTLTKDRLRDEQGRDKDLETVPLFLLAYRSSQHEATGYTPSMLLTGREMKLPIDLIHGKPLTEDDEGGDQTTLPEFVATLEERLKTVHECVCVCEAWSERFQGGRCCLVYQPQRKKGLSPKLQRPWEGPYLNVKKINNLVYRIQMSPKAKPKIVDVERFCPY
ncbi:hypothetical protein NQ315_015144 [Exocentrus adspersus]|uniref:Uncharacterized protein n=1 Tax=Exocentrus adspersus TaxID=1586481 RepID=A0AAV8VEH4_9CUCU|nr:hypothetical protein NQ315_015144 [Exocentrus adspersus]